MRTRVLIGCTQGTGEAEVHRHAEEPTEAAVDIALGGERNGLGDEFIVREPPARRFGKRCGAGLSVVLVEKLRTGDKGVEIKSRELLVRKREKVSAHSGSFVGKKEVFELERL